MPNATMAIIYTLMSHFTVATQIDIVTLIALLVIGVIIILLIKLFIVHSRDTSRASSLALYR